MARVLAIDYGAKRCGLAATDPNQIIASPIGYQETSKVQEFLVSYCKTEKVESIVLGYPLKQDGSDTDATPLVRRFKAWLDRTFPDKKIVLQDEANTSRMAGQAMVAGGMKKKKRREKGQIDAIAATLILQSYLEER